MNPNPKSKEVLQGSPDEKITISSVDELKKQLNISKLPDNLKEFFSQPLETTKGELLDLRKKYLQEEPNIDTIKSFLIKAKQSVLEETRTKVEQAKQVAQNIQKSTEIELKKVTEGKVEGQKADTMVNNLLETTNSTLEKVNNSEIIKDSKEKGKELTEKTKELTKKGVDKLKKSKGIISFITFLEKEKKEGNFFTKFLATIMLFIFGFLGFSKDKIKEEAKEKYEKLTQKEAAETKKYISDFLIKQFPNKKDFIEKTINNPKVFTEEKLQYFYKKIKAGEKITLEDILKQFPEFDKMFSKEEQEKILKEAQEKTLNSIKQALEQKYPGLDISGDKLQTLDKLVKKYFNISNANSLLLHKIVENKGFQFKDIYHLLFEGTTKGTGFTFELISNGIIPLKFIGMDILDTSTDIFKISLGWLGITEKISYDDLVKKTGNLEHPELLLGLLYRKGGLLFSILGDISKVTSQIAIESLTKTPVKSTSLIKSSIFDNFEKQADNFEKLAKTMGAADNSGSEIIKKATANLSKIEQNYKILNILEKTTGSKSSIQKAEKELTKILGENIEGKFSNLSELKLHLEKHFNLPYEARSLTKGAIFSKFGFGENAALFDLSKKLESISTQQKAILHNNKLAKSIGKIREIFEIGEISRLGDKVIYHFDNVEQLNKFSILANKFPNIVGGFFDKLPIFTVAGLALTNENKIESFQKGLLSLVPFIGPLMLLGEGGVYMKDGEIVVKNPIEAGMGGVLLGLDGVFFLKEAIKGGAKGAGGYMIKPLKDVYQIARGGGEFMYDLAKITKFSKAKSLVKGGIKTVSKIPKIGKIAAGLLITGLIGYETLSANDKEVFEDLKREGLIDENGNYTSKLKKAIKDGEINEEEREILIETIIIKNSPIKLSNIELEIRNNQLFIISNNEKIQNDYFITARMIKELNDLFGIKYSSNNFKYENLT